MQYNIIAQNLVPNHSFETYDTCPNYPSQLVYALPWYNANTGTADYFNSCFTTGAENVGVPTNFAGYQKAFDGNAYAGLLLFEWNGSIPLSYREYLQVQSTSTLLNGVRYYVSFMVSCSDSSMFATDDLGVYFSNTSLFQNDYLNLNFVPQISNLEGNLLSDTTNWYCVKGSFLANGGENFMIVGNFKDDSNTDTVRIRNSVNYIKGAYYYFDSFCLSTDSNYCNILNGINPLPNNFNDLTVFPNPTINELNISGINCNKGSITITDFFGSIFYLGNFSDNSQFTISTSSIASGIYILKIKDEANHNFYNRKIIITKN